MFPRVQLRIILTLGKWILLAPKPIKINGKRGSLFCQKNLLTNLRGEFSAHFKAKGPRVPDKYSLGMGYTSDTWQESVAAMLQGRYCAAKERNHIKDFLHG